MRRPFPQAVVAGADDSARSVLYYGDALAAPDLLSRAADVVGEVGRFLTANFSQANTTVHQRPREQRSPTPSWFPWRVDIHLFRAIQFQPR